MQPTGRSLPTPGLNGYHLSVPFRHNVKCKKWTSGYSSSGPSAIHLSGFDCYSKSSWFQMGS